MTACGIVISLLRVLDASSSFVAGFRQPIHKHFALKYVRGNLEMNTLF